MVSFAAAVRVKLKLYFAFAPGSPEISVPLVAPTPFAMNLIAVMLAPMISPVPFEKVIFWELDLPIKVIVPPPLSTAGLLLVNSMNSSAGRWLATNCFFVATPAPSTSKVAS